MFPTSPFVFNPANGNLLLDVTLNANTVATPPLYFEIDNSGETGRVYLSGAAALRPPKFHALYTQFNTPAVPEASTTVSLGVLLALGMGGVVLAAKRRKQTL